jgi:glycine cleavage system H protein
LPGLDARRFAASRTCQAEFCRVRKTNLLNPIGPINRGYEITVTTQASKLRYSKTHEWVQVTGDDDSVVVGVSDYAQSLLGDVVFVELVASGTKVSRGQSIAVIESVKSASDVYAPVSGVIVETNNSVVSSPELINTSALDAGWMFRIKLDDATELDGLMDEEAYQNEYDSALS